MRYGQGLFEYCPPGKQKRRLEGLEIWEKEQYNNFKKS